ncbi:MAG: polyprenyl diphosphate synthase [Legionella sp.]
MEHNIPQHIAMVMDGNGRWAEQRGLLRIEGHRVGVERVKEMVQGCIEHQVPCLSVFAFSSENWSRPADEVNFLMELFLEALQKELAALNDNGVQLCFTGDRAGLSPLLQQQMIAAEALTEKNLRLILNVVVNYGGKWDIVHAAKKMTEAVIAGELALSDINEQSFAPFLELSRLPEPDLFIRTSGELRISNFFLWQLAYTELYFTEVLWPDFDRQQLALALSAFALRKRRYGQISSL